MGQEITSTRFKHYDFQQFDKLVKQEMEVLSQWFRDGRFSTKRSVAGLELEAWLIDESGKPTPWNAQVISMAGTPDIVPELSQFNVEFNVPPRPIAGRGLAELAADLGETWRLCDSAADQLGASVVAIGILPTLKDPMLSLANLSKMHRYKALNEQVLRLREGRPIRLEVQGRESLVSEHRDVMLESAATSFQLHLQVPLSESVRYYNAAVVASTFMVAVSGNSPFLFGASLWEETRIPLFEQSVEIGHEHLPRVTFGLDYARESLEEIFRENEANYPVLLPLAMDEASERLAHIRLQNGTIWRWNRPLIGFDDDGTPHLRIEHRVMAAGPTLIDMTANMALFYGLAESLAQETRPPESCLPFGAARENFYQAARHGLDCEVQWLDGATYRIDALLLAEILPRAATGLARLQVDATLAAQWLEIIEARIRSGQTGAVWQRRFVEQHGKDFVTLTQSYRERQRHGDPVHTWPLDRTPPQTGRVRKSMLKIVDEMPSGLLDVRPTGLFDLLGQPTLIHLPGRRPEPLFVSILLHGNEDVGLLAVQSLFRKYGDRPLPRALSLFVGNVAAARENVRFLPDQPDYNRIWLGADHNETPEHAMMRHVVAEMRERHVFASLDLHNNTGWNPHYACVTRFENAHLQLASLFGRTAVFFQRPQGVQTMAFAEFVPSVTCECGKVGDESGVQHAADFLDACLHLAEIPTHPLPPEDLHVFHTVATITLSAGVELVFDESGAGQCPSQVDLALRGDLERLNFRELVAGTCLGWSRSASVIPLTVTDEAGRNVTDQFLTIKEGRLELLKPVIPSMLTHNQSVMRQDCLGYLMERYALPD